MNTSRTPNRRDLGLTLVELLITVAILGTVMAGVSGAVIVLVKNADSTVEIVADAQDVRQLVNYLPFDVGSTATADVQFEQVTGFDPTIASVCPGVVAANGSRQELVLTANLGKRRIEYTSVPGSPYATLYRTVCDRSSADDPWGAAAVINIADQLDPSNPVDVVWTIGNSRLAMHLNRVGGQVESMSASPFVPDPAQPTPTTEVTATTVAEVPPTGCPANPNQVNEGFMLMAEGNVTFNNGATESYGSTALGGDLTFKNYLAATQSGGTFVAPGDGSATALLVGGKVNWPDSAGGFLKIQNGYLHVGDISNWSEKKGNPNQLLLTANDGSQNKQIRIDDTGESFTDIESDVNALVDFAAKFEELRGITAALSLLPGSCEGVTDLELFGQNGVGQWQNGAVWLYFTPGKATVLSMTMAEYSSITNVNLAAGSAQPGKSTPLIINITDSGSVVMPSGETNLSRNYVPYVLWNFPNATKLTTGGAFWGAILAPNADVVQQGDIRGNVIAKSFVSNGGIIDLKAFEGDFPWPLPGTGQ